MNKKLQLVLFNLGLALAIFGALYWFGQKWDRDIQARIDTVNKDYEYGKGIITDIHLYKGHSVEIKYIVKNNQYEFSGGWDKNPNGLGEGDSIRFKYSTENPELLISELEDEY